MPLLSPQGWDYVLILGVPVVMLLVDRFGDAPRLWQIIFVAAVAMTSFLVFDLYGRSMYFLLIDAGVAFGAIALFAAPCVYAFAALPSTRMGGACAP